MRIVKFIIDKSFDIANNNKKNYVLIMIKY